MSSLTRANFEASSGFARARVRIRSDTDKKDDHRKGGQALEYSPSVSRSCRRKAFRCIAGLSMAAPASNVSVGIAFVDLLPSSQRASQTQRIRRGRIDLRPRLRAAPTPRPALRRSIRRCHIGYCVRKMLLSYFISFVPH